MTAPTLRQRRRTLENQLVELRQARGVATLAGGKFNSADIASLEQEIAGIAEAEAEEAHRQREAEAAPARERLAKLRAQYENEKVHFLAQVGLAEQAARELATRLKAILEHAATMRSTKTASRKPYPSQLETAEVARRLSERLSLQLAGVCHPSKFGSVKLHSGGLLMARGGAAAVLAQAWRDDWTGVLDDEMETERDQAA